MNNSFKKLLACLVLLGGVAAAQAAVNVNVSVGAPGVVVAPPPPRPHVVVPPRHVHHHCPPHHHKHCRVCDELRHRHDVRRKHHHRHDVRPHVPHRHPHPAHRPAPRR